MSHRARALAHPNIALVKYWGKSDDELILPAAGSLSLTLDVFPTTTTVSRVEGDRDVVLLGREPAPTGFSRRVTGFLDHVRSLAGITDRARVDTINTVPTGAGLASSASGFAALAVAASAAYGLGLDRPGLSRLARRGSGSAARSLVPGLAVWHAGDDAASYAEPVPGPELGMVIAVVDAGAKAVTSRDAMRETARTSPYYRAWVAQAAEDLTRMRAALADDDVTRVGRLAEANALAMHAAILASRPPLRFLAPESLRVFDLIAALRDEGLEVYGSADAGPNVVALCRLGDVPVVHEALADRAPGLELIAAGPGPAAHEVPCDEGAP